MHPPSLPESAIDWDELFDYLPGTLVEQVDQPGIIYEIEGYEATMVPPIWLVNDPRPRYPHELRIVSRQRARVCALQPTSAPTKTMHPV
ncbi:hypothetical protein VB780_29685 [Leptolyngbya sp. CCNP1308]|uniref:hypothetical protein n=1 Tax=Leptolyngbya sp. CCNP1308 TaxID=3110255 RepID=UPI002B210D8E|nr:hypothetical protein [Leptolyngbya sp. CCNP1308]MEA5452780.1 hypothetical protein [Leptolyngbya sp. CCNP1308]